MSADYLATISDLIEFGKEKWPEIVVVASYLANAIPNETENKYLKILDSIFNTVAMNFNVKGIANK